MNFYNQFRELEEQLVPLLIISGGVHTPETKPITDAMEKIWRVMTPAEHEKIYAEGPKFDMRKKA
jgi:hypothetical protein